MTKRLRWHRVYRDHDHDYVADGSTQNYLCVRYPYGWELFFMVHGTCQPTHVASGPWHRLKDAKAKAQELENG